MDLLMVDLVEGRCVFAFCDFKGYFWPTEATFRVCLVEQLHVMSLEGFITGIESRVCIRFSEQSLGAESDAGLGFTFMIMYK